MKLNARSSETTKHFYKFSIVQFVQGKNESQIDQSTKRFSISKGNNNNNRNGGINKRK